MSEHKLFVCETCVRDQRLQPPEKSRGRMLADAVQQACAGRPNSDTDWVVRVVSCLSGCLNPCTIALRCRGKQGLRFSRLQASDAAAVVAMAELYVASRDGDVAQSQWPAALVGKLSAKIPPVGGPPADLET